MCNRRFMPSPRFPVPSLRSAYCLPAGRVLLSVSNYLIYFVLRPIRGVVRGVKSNFLPALREATGRQSLEPHAVAPRRSWHTREVSPDCRILDRRGYWIRNSTRRHPGGSLPLPCRSWVSPYITQN